MGEAEPLIDTRPPGGRAPRHAAEGIARLRCAGRPAFQAGFLRDISAGGMFVRVLDPAGIGPEVDFELAFGDRPEKLVGRAEVRWARGDYEGPGRPPGVGLRFLALGGDALGGAFPPSLRLRRAESPAGDGATEPVREALAGVPVPLAEPAGDFAASGARATPPAFGTAGPAGVPVNADPPEISERPQTSREADVQDLSEDLEMPPHRPRRRWIPVVLGLIAAVALVVVLARMGVGAPQIVEPPPLPGVAAPVAEVEPAPEAAEAVGAPAAAGGVAAPEAAESPASGPWTLGEVSWRRDADGVLWITLAGAGALDPGSIDLSRIGGEAPRAVLRLPGARIEAPRRWEVGETEVTAVRSAFHPAPEPAVHVVLDLASAAVEVAPSVESDGTVTLRVAPR